VTAGGPGGVPRTGGADDLAARLADVRRRLVAAAARSGRSGTDIHLVVVTKGVAVPAIASALDAGARDLGESRAQELLAKAEAPELGDRPVWHFVGRLQRNKIGALAPVVSLWQSVDRLEVGEAIARRAPGASVLVEVNVAGDRAKAGCRPEHARALVDGLGRAGLVVRGLMTVPALGPDPRPAFAALAELGGRLGLPELSMGMSDDFEAAVEEGATMVRVGRAIFEPQAKTGPPTPPSSLQR